MRKLSTLLFLFLLSLTTLAYDFQVDQLCYNILSDTEVEVTYQQDPWSEDATYPSLSGVVIIPSSVTYNETTYTVTSIGNYAFTYCSYLISITIPSSVTSIGDYTFFNCSSLNSVTIPSTITNMGGSAFAGCSSLISVTIPSSVTSIGDHAFFRCSSLANIQVEVGNLYYASENGVLFNADKTTLVQYPTGKTETTYIIPTSVTSIEGYAFNGCSSLTSVTIPSNVTSIGRDVFSGTPLYNDASNWVDNVLYIDNCLIQANSELFGAYDIVAGTRVIVDYAFAYCSSLTTVTIPSSVTSIGEGVFNNCSSLTSVTIPTTITSIGSGAFLGCISLASAIIPNCVTSIGDNAFYYCSSLTSVTIPEGVISIGGNAFHGCSSLTTVYWDAVNCSDFYCSDMFNRVLPGWSNVSTFVLGEGVEHIPAYLCASLPITEITIPNSVTSIGDEAFSECSSLTSVTIPNSVTSIGTSAFNGVKELSVYKNYSSIVLEVPFVKMSPSLDTLVCPVSELNQITDQDLLSCSKQVESITVHSGQLDSNGFAYVTRQKKTLTILDMENTTNTELTDMALYDCYYLHTIKLPSKLEYIGYKAIAECVELQQIIIPAYVAEIDDSAFENCRSLSAIHFGGTTPEGRACYAPAASESALQRIGNWAFYNCYQLQELTIPEGVTEIGDAAFYGCTYLEDLVLPSSLQSIGDNCFALCSKLQQITVQSTTPPTIASNTFYDVKRTIPVYIPEGTLESYQEDTYWSEFLLIEDNSDTALPETQDDQTGCYTANGMLHNPNGISLCIYTMQGTLVYTGNATEIQMPSQGIYILKTPTATSKVIL